jgi:hypothetical protein
METIELETIKGILEKNGVLCQIRNRHYTYHPELDYDYIKCYKDCLEFETTLKDGDLPVLQFVCILNGQRYGLNRMFSPIELNEERFIGYIIQYSVDYFIREVYKQTK